MGWDRQFINPYTRECNNAAAERVAERRRENQRQEELWRNWTSGLLFLESGGKHIPHETIRAAIISGELDITNFDDTVKPEDAKIYPGHLAVFFEQRQVYLRNVSIISLLEKKPFPEKDLTPEERLEPALRSNQVDTACAQRFALYFWHNGFGDYRTGEMAEKIKELEQFVTPGGSYTKERIQRWLSEVAPPEAKKPGRPKEG